MQSVIFGADLPDLQFQPMDPDLFEFYSFQTDIAHNPEIIETIMADFSRLVKGTEHTEENGQCQNLLDKLQPLLDENDRVATSTHEKKVFIKHPAVPPVILEHDPELMTKNKFIRQMSMPKYLEDAITAEVKKMWDNGRIDLASTNIPVNDRWNSQIFAVTTYDLDGNVKKLRVVPNMINVNKGLLSPPTALPLIKSILQRCAAGALYSEIDLQTSFLLLELAAESRHKTAFTWPPNSSVRYEFYGAPWGLTFLSGTMQRALEAILEGMSFVIIFVDNILIISPNDWNVHYIHLAEVIMKLNEHFVKMNSKKLQFGYRSMHTLGFKFSQYGVSIAEEKLEAVSKWSVPSNCIDLTTKMGFLGYLRDQIPAFADVAKPLHTLCNMAYL